MAKFKQKSRLFRIICVLLIFLLIENNLEQAQAQGTPFLPSPQNNIIEFSTPYSLPVLRGMRTYPDKPFQFDFIVDSGDRHTVDQKETSLLIKYFLTCLTMPQKDLWVNLSPYESGRIIPDELALTDAGNNLLEQDKLLKQLASSLTYPESRLGKEFWAKVYKIAYERFGTTDLPVNTFNKVWIVPSKAVVYDMGTSALIGETHLKVMLEEDYLALKKHIPTADQGVINLHTLTSLITKEIILPELEKEVNEGKNFAPVRQIFHSMILAAWFKQALKRNVLSNFYVNKKKISGVDGIDKNAKEQIYKQYLHIYKVGAYNYIREDVDPITQQVIPRKYFSGGVNFGDGNWLLTLRAFHADVLKPFFARHKDSVCTLARVMLTVIGNPGALNQWLRQPDVAMSSSSVTKFAFAVMVSAAGAAAMAQGQNSSPSKNVHVLYLGERIESSNQHAINLVEKVIQHSELAKTGVIGKLGTPWVYHFNSPGHGLYGSYVGTKGELDIVAAQLLARNLLKNTNIHVTGDLDQSTIWALEQTLALQESGHHSTPISTVASRVRVQPSSISVYKTSTAVGVTNAATTSSATNTSTATSSTKKSATAPLNTATLSMNPLSQNSQLGPFSQIRSTTNTTSGTMVNPDGFPFSAAPKFTASSSTNTVLSPNNSFHSFNLGSPSPLKYSTDSTGGTMVNPDSFPFSAVPKFTTSPATILPTITSARSTTTAKTILVAPRNSTTASPKTAAKTKTVKKAKTPSLEVAASRAAAKVAPKAGGSLLGGGDLSNPVGLIGDGTGRIPIRWDAGGSKPIYSNPSSSTAAPGRGSRSGYQPPSSRSRIPIDNDQVLVVEPMNPDKWAADNGYVRVGTTAKKQQQNSGPDDSPGYDAKGKYTKTTTVTLNRVPFNALAQNDGQMFMNDWTPNTYHGQSTVMGTLHDPKDDARANEIATDLLPKANKDYNDKKALKEQGAGKPGEDLESYTKVMALKIELAEIQERQANRKFKSPANSVIDRFMVTQNGDQVTRGQVVNSYWARDIYLVDFDLPYKIAYFGGITDFTVGGIKPIGYYFDDAKFSPTNNFYSNTTDKNTKHLRMYVFFAPGTELSAGQTPKFNGTFHRPRNNPDVPDHIVPDPTASTRTTVDSVKRFPKKAKVGAFYSFKKHPGDSVDVGDILAEGDSTYIDKQIALISEAIDNFNKRHDLLLPEGGPARIQGNDLVTFEKEGSDLREKLATLKQEKADLVITSPGKGRVLTPPKGALPEGTPPAQSPENGSEFFPAGEPLIWLSDGQTDEGSNNPIVEGFTIQLPITMKDIKIGEPFLIVTQAGKKFFGDVANVDKTPHIDSTTQTEVQLVQINTPQDLDGYNFFPGEEIVASRLKNPDDIALAKSVLSKGKHSKAGLSASGLVEPVAATIDIPDGHGGTTTVSAIDYWTSASSTEAPESTPGSAPATAQSSSHQAPAPESISSDTIENAAYKNELNFGALVLEYIKERNFAEIPGSLSINADFQLWLMGKTSFNNFGVSAQRDNVAASISKMNLGSALLTLAGDIRDQQLDRLGKERRLGRVEAQIIFNNLQIKIYQTAEKVYEAYIDLACAQEKIKVTTKLINRLTSYQETMDKRVKRDENFPYQTYESIGRYIADRQHHLDHDLLPAQASLTIRLNSLRGNDIHHRNQPFSAVLPSPNVLPQINDGSLPTDYVNNLIEKAGLNIDDLMKYFISIPGDNSRLIPNVPEIKKGIKTEPAAVSAVLQTILEKSTRENDIPGMVDKITATASIARKDFSAEEWAEMTKMGWIYPVSLHQSDGTTEEVAAIQEKFFQLYERSLGLKDEDFKSEKKDPEALLAAINPEAIREVLKIKPGDKVKLPTQRGKIIGLLDKLLDFGGLHKYISIDPNDQESLDLVQKSENNEITPREVNSHLFGKYFSQLTPDRNLNFSIANVSNQRARVIVTILEMAIDAAEKNPNPFVQQAMNEQLVLDYNKQLLAIQNSWTFKFISGLIGGDSAPKTSPGTWFPSSELNQSALSLPYDATAISTIPVVNTAGKIRTNGLDLDTKAAILHTWEVISETADTVTTITVRYNSSIIQAKHAQSSFQEAQDAFSDKMKRGEFGEWEGAGFLDTMATWQEAEIDATGRSFIEKWQLQRIGVLPPTPIPRKIDKSITSSDHALTTEDEGISRRDLLRTEVGLAVLGGMPLLALAEGTDVWEHASLEEIETQLIHGASINHFKNELDDFLKFQNEAQKFNASLERIILESKNKDVVQSLFRYMLGRQDGMTFFIYMIDKLQKKKGWQLELAYQFLMDSLTNNLEGTKSLTRNQFSSTSSSFKVDQETAEKVFLTLLAHNPDSVAMGYFLQSNYWTADQLASIANGIDNNDKLKNLIDHWLLRIVATNYSGPEFNLGAFGKSLVEDTDVNDQQWIEQLHALTIDFLNSPSWQDMEDNLYPPLYQAIKQYAQTKYKDKNAATSTGNSLYFYSYPKDSTEYYFNHVDQKIQTAHVDKLSGEGNVSELVRLFESSRTNIRPYILDKLMLTAKGRLLLLQLYSKLNPNIGKENDLMVSIKNHNGWENIETEIKTATNPTEKFIYRNAFEKMGSTDPALLNVRLNNTFAILELHSARDPRAQAVDTRIHKEATKLAAYAMLARPTTNRDKFKTGPSTSVYETQTLNSIIADLEQKIDPTDIQKYLDSLPQTYKGQVGTEGQDGYCDYDALMKDLKKISDTIYKKLKNNDQTIAAYPVLAEGPGNEYEGGIQNFKDKILNSTDTNKIYLYFTEIVAHKDMELLFSIIDVLADQSKKRGHAQTGLPVFKRYLKKQS